ncbi:multiubiquitin domain-containing protein [Actinomadura sp. WAC 06369]|uniref:multiubiquitin domain-containing protein n=1 Tax=Actinomadura sp. WAC 06369 TaxID=2203193 RepID=UPI0022781F36|nr:multiubiquitin domain-containing protein [Actinomadura sp. WAC 06369]
MDGRHFMVTDSAQTAAALLRLAGLDPSAYNLAEVRHGHGEPKRYDDAETIRIRNGDKFVTVRQCAQVA